MNPSSLSSHAATILIIDDAAEIHNLAKVVLQPHGMKLLSAYNGREGLALALRNTPDLILLDYQMPDVDGLSVLKFLKGEPSLASIPVIMVTASNDPQLVIDTFANGAADYVRKPFISSELQARVLASLRVQKLISELCESAQSDALTKLPNRRAFNRQLIRTLDHGAGGKGGSLAIFFIDLDQFKLINDSLGHSFGDRVIQEVAKRLQNELNDNPLIRRRTHTCSLARVGGDEFLVLADGIDQQSDAQFIAECLINSLSERYSIGSHCLYSSCSIGIAFADANRRATTYEADDLIRNADIALYEAKASGRACSRVFDTHMRERVERRVEIECELRRATERKEFHLVYQPIVNLSTGRFESVEALIRWDHPVRGVVSPAEFIPIAEETGLINDIGEWCMQNAFRQFAKWQRESPVNAPKSINVNIARQQLLRPRFFEQVAEIASAEGLSPSQIHLEITESEIMSEPEVSISVLKTLRDAGFKIDIDDFGTGYSSLACLSQFPVDTLKIDRGLIAHITHDRYSAKLVEFVLRLAQETNIKVVAEGIELLEQSTLLNAWGCELGQGFLMARPMKAELILTFADKWNREHQCRNHAFKIPVTN